VWGAEGCREMSRDVMGYRGISWKKWKKLGDDKNGKVWGVKRGAWYGALVFIHRCFLLILIFYQRIYLPPSYTDRIGKVRRPSTIIFHSIKLTHLQAPHASSSLPPFSIALHERSVLFTIVCISSDDYPQHHIESIATDRT